MLSQCLFIDFLINTTLEMTVYSFIHYVHYDMFQPVIAAISRECYNYVTGKN